MVSKSTLHLENSLTVKLVFIVVTVQEYNNYILFFKRGLFVNYHSSILQGRSSSTIGHIW